MLGSICRGSLGKGGLPSSSIYSRLFAAPAAAGSKAPAAAPKAAAPKGAGGGKGAPAAPAGKAPKVIPKPPLVTPPAIPVFSPFNTKNAVMLTRLDSSVTSKSLSESLKDVYTRKVELQPGCQIFVSNEASADRVCEILTSSANGCQTRVAKTMLPSVEFKNIDPNGSVSTLMSSFKDYNVKSGHKSGGSSIHISFSKASDALKAVKELEEMSFGGESLKTYSKKTADNKFVVKVFNLSNGTIPDDAQAAIKAKFPSTTISMESPANPTFSLRFSSNQVSNVNLKDMKDFLTSIGEDLKFSVTDALIPALFIRNTMHMTKQSISTLLTSGDIDARNVQFLNRSSDVRDDLVIATFKSEAAAHAALRKLKGVVVQGKKLSFGYREIASPAVQVNYLGAKVKENDLRDILKIFPVSAITIEEGEEDSSSSESSSSDSESDSEDASSVRKYRCATIVFNDPKDAANASILLSRSASKILDESYIKRINNMDRLRNKGAKKGSDVSKSDAPSAIQNIDLKDRICEVTLPKGYEKSLLDYCKSNKFPFLSVTMDTNQRASLTFATLDEAKKAHDAYLSGKVAIAGSGNVSSRVGVAPSFAVEVENLSTDIPMSKIIQAFKDTDVSNHLIHYDRAAIVKFTRSIHVDTGVKKIKAIDINGKKLCSVEKITDIRAPSKDNSEYSSNSSNDAFDRLTLRSLVSDNLESDPATRYKVAKNMFERALSDAKNNKHIEYLLDPKVSSPEMVAEARMLLSQPVSTPEISQRLFDLFIQRDDMITFVKDFKEMISLFGDVDESDPFNWSQFDISNSDDLSILQQALKERENDLMTGDPKLLRKKVDNYLKSTSATSDASEGTVISGKKSEYLESDDGSKDAPMDLADEDSVKYVKDLKSIKVETDEGDDINVDLEVKDLEDSDGRVWSGTILHMDVVQRTMPQNRVNSNRALVVIGNMKGVAGFGVGKADSAKDAVAAAFRDALKNLTFIDLYDNFGLAHDLEGKHNSCRTYIRATPRARLMIASPFAESILTAFGIGSASCKLVGRRNPYSITRAMFNAISKHQNLDEIAKARGKRYLTLKWLQDHNI